MTVHLGRVLGRRIGNAADPVFLPSVTWATSLEDLMFDALSFVEVDVQHVELLPARTVLSLFSAGGGGRGGNGGTGGANWS
jgi:hypothetical protein